MFIIEHARPLLAKRDPNEVQLKYTLLSRDPIQNSQYVVYLLHERVYERYYLYFWMKNYEIRMV